MREIRTLGSVGAKAEWLSYPTIPDLFVFVGKRKDRCKVLFWERGGFVLVYKRLERGRFQLPQHAPEEFEMTSSELAMLLDGLNFSRVQRSRAWRPLKKSERKGTRGIDKAI